MHPEFIGVLCPLQVQTLGASYLSTIETVYHLCRAWISRRDGRYEGQVDNLLLYFVSQVSLCTVTFHVYVNLFSDICSI